MVLIQRGKLGINTPETSKHVPIDFERMNQDLKWGNHNSPSDKTPVTVGLRLSVSRQKTGTSGAAQTSTSGVWEHTDAPHCEALWGLSSPQQHCLEGIFSCSSCAEKPPVCSIWSSVSYAKMVCSCSLNTQKRPTIPPATPAPRYPHLGLHIEGCQMEGSNEQFICVNIRNASRETTSQDRPQPKPPAWQ